MSHISNLYRLLPVFLLILPACSEDLNDFRAERFVNPPQQSVEVMPSAASLTLHVSPTGQSLSTKSIKRLNEMLRAQGRLHRQTITLMPRTPVAEKFAERLASVLKRNGLPPNQLHMKTALEAVEMPEDEKIPDDLLIISEALIVKVPDCSISDPDLWTIAPYSAVGSLGCATRANLARIVSDPRDLIRPRTFSAADGEQAIGAIERYHDDDVRELMTIDFSED